MSAFKYFTFSRLISWIMLHLSKWPMPSDIRWRFLKSAGVRFTKKKPTSHIYENVTIDTVRPDQLTIGDNVTITTGVIILTHFIQSGATGREFSIAPVVIEDDVFIGAGTIICNSVTIGKGSLIGAGSIVTKDIPAGEVWAGNPARFIRRRGE